MTDGAALLAAQTWSLLAAGMWKDDRGTNLLDTGAPFYDTYACADGKYLAIGALEPHFFAVLKEKIGLSSDQLHRDLQQELTDLFATRTRDEWCLLLEGTDACVAPVLSLAEAPLHPHNAARQTFYTENGIVQPSPAPRFQTKDQ
jgi:alpha-methylacyl-CoA racemase